MFQKFKSALLVGLFVQLILLAQSRTTDKVITRQPSTTSAFVGTKVSFEIQTQTITQRRVVWYLNDKVASDASISTRIRIDVKENMNNSVVYAKVYSDADLLETSDPAYLYVLGKPTLNVPQYVIRLTPGVSPVTFSDDKTDITVPVFVGQTWAINLTQYVTGEGLVWQWTQNSRAMRWSEDGLVYMDKGDLQLTAGKDDINTVYQLNVTNPAGTVLSRGIKFIKPMAPKFKKNLPKYYTTFGGEEVEITVQFVEDGYTCFQWALNGEDIFRETQPSIKLTAHSGLNGANLTVTATNPSGQTVQTITLRVFWAKWAIAVITISIIVTLAAALFALAHKGIIRKPACMDRSRVKYSLQQLNDNEDDLALTIEVEEDN